MLSSRNLPCHLLGLFAGVGEVGAARAGGECVRNRLLLAASGLWVRFVSPSPLLALSPHLSVTFSLALPAGAQHASSRWLSQLCPQPTAGWPPSPPESACLLIWEAASDWPHWHGRHQLCSRVVNRRCPRGLQQAAETHQSALFEDHGGLGTYHSPDTLPTIWAPPSEVLMLPVTAGWCYPGVSPRRASPLPSWVNVTQI